MSDKKNTIELPRTVVELWRFLHQDEDAPCQKRTVYIETGDRRKGHGSAYSASAFATNGHHMCVVHWPSMHEGDTLHLPGWMLRDASRSDVIDQEGGYPPRVWQVTRTATHGIRINTQRDDGGLYAPTQEMPSIDWAPVWSKPVREKGATPTGELRVNMRLVAEFAEYLEACGISGTECRLQVPGDELDPLRVDVEADYARIRYIVMPCKP